MGPGDEALPGLPAGDRSASGERPIRLQRQGETFTLVLSRSHPVGSEPGFPVGDLNLVLDWFSDGSFF